MKQDEWNKYRDKVDAFVEETKATDGIKKVSTLSVYDGHRLPDLNESFKNSVYRLGSADIIVIFRSPEE